MASPTQAKSTSISGGGSASPTSPRSPAGSPRKKAVPPPPIQHEALRPVERVKPALKMFDHPGCLLVRVVSKLCKDKRDTRQRVMIITNGGLYLCHFDGNVNRYVVFNQVTTIMVVRRHILIRSLNQPDLVLNFTPHAMNMCDDMDPVVSTLHALAKRHSKTQEPYTLLQCESAQKLIMEAVMSVPVTEGETTADNATASRSGGRGGKSNLVLQAMVALQSEVCRQEEERESYARLTGKDDASKGPIRDILTEYEPTMTSEDIEQLLADNRGRLRELLSAMRVKYLAPIVRKTAPPVTRKRRSQSLIGVPKVEMLPEEPLDPNVPRAMLPPASIQTPESRSVIPVPIQSVPSGEAVPSVAQQEPQIIPSSIVEEETASSSRNYAAAPSAEQLAAPIALQEVRSEEQQVVERPTGAAAVPLQQQQAGVSSEFVTPPRATGAHGTTISTSMEQFPIPDASIVSSSPGMSVLQSPPHVGVGAMGAPPPTAVVYHQPTANPVIGGGNMAALVKAGKILSAEKAKRYDPSSGSFNSGYVRNNRPPAHAPPSPPPPRAHGANPQEMRFSPLRVIVDDDDRRTMETASGDTGAGPRRRQKPVDTEIASSPPQWLDVTPPSSPGGSDLDENEREESEVLYEDYDVAAMDDLHAVDAGTTRPMVHHQKNGGAKVLFGGGTGSRVLISSDYPIITSTERRPDEGEDEHIRLEIESPVSTVAEGIGKHSRRRVVREPQSQQPQYGDQSRQQRRASSPRDSAKTKANRAHSRQKLSAPSPSSPYGGSRKRSSHRRSPSTPRSESSSQSFPPSSPSPSPASSFRTPRSSSPGVLFQSLGQFHTLENRDREEDINLGVDAALQSLARFRWRSGSDDEVRSNRTLDEEESIMMELRQKVYGPLGVPRSASGGDAHHQHGFTHHHQHQHELLPPEAIQRIDASEQRHTPGTLSAGAPRVPGLRQPRPPERRSPTPAGLSPFSSVSPPRERQRQISPPVAKIVNISPQVPPLTSQVPSGGVTPSTVIHTFEVEEPVMPAWAATHDQLSGSFLRFVAESSSCPPALDCNDRFTEDLSTFVTDLGRAGVDLGPSPQIRIHLESVDEEPQPQQQHGGRAPSPSAANGAAIPGVDSGTALERSYVDVQQNVLAAFWSLWRQEYRWIIQSTVVDEQQQQQQQQSIAASLHPLLNQHSRSVSSVQKTQQLPPFYAPSSFIATLQHAESAGLGSAAAHEEPIVVVRVGDALDNTLGERTATSIELPLTLWNKTVGDWNMRSAAAGRRGAEGMMPQQHEDSQRRSSE